MGGNEEKAAEALGEDRNYGIEFCKKTDVLLWLVEIMLRPGEYASEKYDERRTWIMAANAVIKLCNTYEETKELYDLFVKAGGRA